jgi:hypothetical protein
MDEHANKICIHNSQNLSVSRMIHVTFTAGKRSGEPAGKILILESRHDRMFAEQPAQLSVWD